MHYLDYNEEKQHGTRDFPIEFYHVDQYHPSYHMPYHWHVELEMIRILSGIFHLKLDDEEIQAEPGDIIFINAGVIHGGMPDTCTYECIVLDCNRLLMHTEICKTYVREITEGRIPAHIRQDGKTEFFFQAANHFFDSIRNGVPGKELDILGSLFKLFGVIYRQKMYVTREQIATNQTEVPSILKMAQLKPALKYIEEHYQDDITLEDLSKISNLSTKYFCYYFRSMIHRTPIEYLNYYRIEQACSLLCTSNYLITEVAFLCGYNDTSYFIKTFKRYKGMTPKQYSLKGNGKTMTYKSFPD